MGVRVLRLAGFVLLALLVLMWGYLLQGYFVRGLVEGATSGQFFTASARTSVLPLGGAIVLLSATASRRAKDHAAPKPPRFLQALGRTLIGLTVVVWVFVFLSFATSPPGEEQVAEVVSGLVTLSLVPLGSGLALVWKTWGR